jgi:hypothetical protein
VARWAGRCPAKRGFTRCKRNKGQEASCIRYTDVRLKPSRYNRLVLVKRRFHPGFDRPVLTPACFFVLTNYAVRKIAVDFAAGMTAKDKKHRKKLWN